MTTAKILLLNALKCKCPQCAGSGIFKSKFTLDVKDNCPNCGLKLGQHDSADGPAVFLIFVLGFLLVPLALLVEVYFEPTLMAHAVIWTITTLMLTVGLLKPLKSFVIALQYKYRRSDWTDAG
ncbi:MAG: hypothetical protein CMH28_05570 [Micavibrio sp.]|nr:hypothetical protein [Micavibrio sp.]|tara:strand:+ start:356 stop:724 length:369 start_codon:yes stop_codon:yes gene_type:complete